MNNQKDVENKIILENIKNYSPSIIGILTFVGIIALNILKLIEYIKAQYYFDYYGLDIKLYKYSEQGFIYGLCISIIFLLAIISLPFFISQIIANVKRKKIVNTINLRNLIIVLLFNFIWIYSMRFNKIISIILFCIFIIIEYATPYIIFSIKEEKKDVSLKSALKFVPIYILLLILCIGISDISNLKLKTEYRIISDNKVIVYSNNDYYLTLDCEVKKDKLIIYKGKQNKTNADNVRSELINFDKVEIK